MPRVCHVCLAGSAAEQVGQIVDGDRVLAHLDDLAIGPLSDVDTALLPGRLAFWREMLAVRLPRESIQVDHAMRQQVHDLSGLARDADEVVIWHGTHASERLMRCRVCWWLRETDTRVFEVRVAEAGAMTRIAVAMREVEALRALAARREPMSAAERAACAQEWVDWRDGGSGIRDWCDGRLCGLPIDGDDGALLAMAMGGPHRLLRLIGQAMTETGRADVFYRWRATLLIQSGRLKVVRGGLDDWHQAWVSAA